jgi:nitrate reductase NapE component
MPNLLTLNKSLSSINLISQFVVLKVCVFVLSLTFQIAYRFLVCCFQSAVFSVTRFPLPDIVEHNRNLIRISVNLIVPS